MNVQEHMSGQIAGQIPNQAGIQLPGAPQQNESSFSYHTQNSGSHQNAVCTDPQLLKARRFMQEKIYELLIQRQQQAHDRQPKQFVDFVRRLDDILFRTAASKDEYMSLETLETRLHVLIRRLPRSNHHQRHSQLINSSSTATMIPTPRMTQTGNSSIMKTSAVDPSIVASSGCNGIAPATSVTGNLLQTTNARSGSMPGGSFNSSDGTVSNGHEHPLSDFSINSSGNMVSSSWVQNKMIPTPGFNSNSSQSLMNLESCNDTGGFSTNEPTTISQPLPQKQHIGGQNGRILHNLGTHMGGGTRSGLQQKAYGFSNSGLGDGNFYGSVTSAGSDMHNRNLNPASLQSRHQQQLQQQHGLSQQQQRQQNQQIQQHQIISKNDSFGHSQLTCDLEQLQYSAFQNQFQQSSAEDHSRFSQALSLPSVSQETQTSQQMQQLLHPHQLVTDSQNDFSCLSVRVQSERALPGQWRSVDDKSQSLGNMTQEQNVRDEFRQRITGQDEAHCNIFGSICEVVTKRPEPPTSGGAACRSGNLNRERQFKNQQRWLLFLRHARRCMAPPGKCHEVNCVTAQKLWVHIIECKASQCPYPRCHHTKMLLHHHKHCRDPGCPVCVPVTNYLQTQLKARACSDSNLGLPRSINGSCNSEVVASKTSPSMVQISEDLCPLLKRLKTELPSQSLVCESESSAVSVLEEHKYADTCLPMKSEVTEVKMEIHGSSRHGSPSVCDMQKDTMDCTYSQKHAGGRIMLDDSIGFVQQECINIEKVIDQARPENVVLPVESAVGSKFGKPKIKGVSMTELFTPDQVREHIIGLRQWVGQSKSKAEKNQAMEHSMSENSCQLCAVEKLTFEPPPIYCSPCGARIKRNAMYYTIGAGDTRHFFCIPCYNDARGDTILVDGTTIPKARLEKKKNDEETEEWWVQCDKCEAWQHQICALFNGRRNDGGQAEYTCPNCYIDEVERGERNPLPESAVLGAKDLPRTILSDHIENRLFRRLKQEKQERARVQGKGYDEVPGAEALVVRVVSSVDKKLEVKQRFLEIFQENYQAEFPYKSKVVVLFQKIEGVEVCLFSMYVQEFGSECQHPNHRRVYLSYLDSVKYFRPEIKAVTGEALRTFVYHEILIGYLEYCKIRGFTSCYIWACPPLKGEDYILYCHPEIQKTPKSDKLREWYLSMLRKASKENIVVELTNLYDHFFVSTGECKAKITAARLPYFDGDYWPGAAEDMIYQLGQEEDCRKQYKKGTTKKAITKRALKLSGQSDLSGNASKDWLLMHKLGETITPMKEDFIMVHLQHACTHCCILMTSGNRWVCNQCKKFQLCDKCYEAEQKLEERLRHPINQRDKHLLYHVEIDDVAEDTKDRDEILESEFFDTRQAFLSLCQGNHYQYDTLRRAKHSSMMVLYHLHNPTAPAFVTTCTACHLDIEAGQGWRCEICPDYDVCNACYQKDGGIDHPHQLTNHPSMADRDAQNTEAREMRVVQLRKMLDLLVHASQCRCRSPNCPYPNCRKVKGLFRHGIQCKIRASGGCLLCKKMWYLLQLHARACKESECNVPRCRDLKEHLRRLQQQSDSRRRAAVMEMMRQRAAEVASNVE